MFRSYRNSFNFSYEFSVNLYICTMYEYFDKDLGKIIVKQDGRKRKNTVSRRQDYYLVTVPTDFPHDKLPEIIERNKSNLLKLKPLIRPTIDENTEIKSLTFSVKICRTSLFDEKIKMTLANGTLSISVPESIDIKESTVQKKIKEMIRTVLRKEAKRVLPKKTMDFAKELGLEVAKVKINSSVGRWGSCSSYGIINYSLYLMLLEERYIDYIILHELAHRRYLSHDDRFWDYLSELCGEDARLIREEMKQNISKTKFMLLD